MTLKDVISAGYTCHHRSWYRGYISRRTDPENLPAYPYEGKFGKGYYVLFPSWRSSWYCTIAYYTNKTDNPEEIDRQRRTARGYAEIA